MSHSLVRLCCLAVSLAIGPSLVAAKGPAAKLPTPKAAFGHAPGTDRKLVDYQQLIAYVRDLAIGSPRLELRQVGRSPEGRPMFVLFISSKENIARLDALKAINRRLALDTEIPDGERASLIADGRVFVMATLSMHSTEVGPSQTLPLYAYELATSTDPAVLAQLRQAVWMIVPSHNPDGMDRVVTYYRNTLGTPYEGSSLPGVYHKYVGHDNNRDFVTLTQTDTRVINRLYSTEWFPQVLVEKHQMGKTHPRYYVPPAHDPIAENIDEGLWNWSGIFGAALARDMDRDGRSGVVQHWLFDNYWPGSTETSHWKGVISFLTEAASAAVASPIWIEVNEMRVHGKGLAEYDKSINMPNPWPGGWWKLSDIIDYELSSFRSILATAAAERTAILTFRNNLARKEVARGRSESPAYFVLPATQRDRGLLPQLVALLIEHGVEVYQLSKQTAVDGRLFQAGSVVVPMSQPYRAFAKEVLEAQRYPERHYTTGGPLIKPYDITTWSLPLHWGLESHGLDHPSAALDAALERLTAPPEVVPPTVTKNTWGLAVAATDNDAYRVAFAALARGSLRVERLLEPLRLAGETLPVGSFLISGKRLALTGLARVGTAPVHVLKKAPAARRQPVNARRIGLVESWAHDMDAGWTRYLLDDLGIPFRVLRPSQLARLDLLEEIDLLLMPDEDKNILMEGRPKKKGKYSRFDLAPEFAKGIGKKGMQKLVEFLDGGGIIVAWRGSTGLFTDEISIEHDEDTTEVVQLPVRDVSEQAIEKGLMVPGALLHVDLSVGHPLTWGLPERINVFARESPVFATQVPVHDSDRRVLARYPKNDLLASGYLAGDEHLARGPALVWVRKGKGQLLLFGFHPHSRASTPGTYKFLYNALLLPQLPVK